jgi:hypothetical protein
MFKSDYSKNKYCKCGKLITNRAIHCSNCGGRFAWKKISKIMNVRLTKKLYIINKIHSI